MYLRVTCNFNFLVNLKEKHTFSHTSPQPCNKSPYWEGYNVYHSPCCLVCCFGINYIFTMVLITILVMVKMKFLRVKVNLILL